MSDELVERLKKLQQEQEARQIEIWALHKKLAYKKIREYAGRYFKLYESYDHDNDATGDNGFYEYIKITNVDAVSGITAISFTRCSRDRLEVRYDRHIAADVLLNSCPEEIDRQEFETAWQVCFRELCQALPVDAQKGAAK